MINKKENQQEWCTLMYELEDSVEHLNSLIAQMSTDGEIDEVDYKTQLGHIYAHLNRGWNSINLKEYRLCERGELTKMPDDLEPVG
jgi:hypothetical protein